MLKVVKDIQDGILSLKLVGGLDEYADFDKYIGDPTRWKEIHINCKQIRRLTSHGTRAWIVYFQALADKKVPYKLFECSPAFIDQLNLFKNFIPGGEVVSMCIPFLCSSCKEMFVSVMETAEIRRRNFLIPEIACTSCKSGKATFDEIESDYFHFLKR